MSKKHRVVTAAEAVQFVGSGDSIYLSSAGSVPKVLVDALCARARSGGLADVKLRHIHTAETANYAAAEYAGIFASESFFVGGNVRREVQAGNADYIPVALHETQKLFRSGCLACDVAMVQVSRPDRHGFVSLGTSVDIGPAAIQCARTVIAVMNRYVPFSYGDGVISLDEIDYIVEHDSPIETMAFPLPDEAERVIGRHCSELIDDGSCLQLGIGEIPNAVLSQLSDRRDLGVHTEMFADGLLPLVESGVINGSRKKIDRGKIVASFLMGSQNVYNFVHRNPQVRMREVAYTNDPFIIARNPKVVAINSAIQIDLTGQVCADSIGTKMYSGVGGAAGLHLRRLPFAGGQAGDRDAVGHPEGDQQDCSGADAGGGGGDAAQSGALCRHRIRRGESLRQIVAAACEGADRHRASGLPRGAGKGGVRTVRSPFPRPLARGGGYTFR